MYAKVSEIFQYFANLNKILNRPYIQVIYTLQYLLNKQNFYKWYKKSVCNVMWCIEFEW